MASAYAQSARNLDKYSRYGEAGGARKDPNLEKEASQIKANASKMATQSARGGGTKPTGRKVFVMRHGERMDRLFPEWLTVAITDEVNINIFKRIFQDEFFCDCLGKISAIRHESTFDDDRTSWWCWMGRIRA